MQNFARGACPQTPLARFARHASRDCIPHHPKIDGYGPTGVYNWGRITVRYMGVRCSEVSNVLKSMEKRSGLSELSIISAVEGCPLRGVPL